MRESLVIRNVSPLTLDLELPNVDALLPNHQIDLLALGLSKDVILRSKAIKREFARKRLVYVSESNRQNHTLETLARNTSTDRIVRTGYPFVDIVEIQDDYELDKDDGLILVTGSKDIRILLSPATEIGRILYIRKHNDSAQKITLVAQNGQHISEISGNYPTYTFDNKRATVVLVAADYEWVVLNSPSEWFVVEESNSKQ